MTKNDEKEAVHCPSCEKAVLAKVVGRAVYNEELPDHMERCTLMICAKCQQLILQKQMGGLDFGINEIGEEDWFDVWDDPITLYPTRHKNFDSSVPTNVVRTYSEAIKCMNAGSYTAATIMGRRTLEIVCAELGEKSKNKKLFDKIEALANKGASSGKVADWAERLRHVGNFAAHDPDITFTRQQATIFIDFAEALIEHCFVLEKKFQLFDKYVKSLKT